LRIEDCIILSKSVNNWRIPSPNFVRPIKSYFSSDKNGFLPLKPNPSKKNLRMLSLP
jgi:hypothetical protein